MKTIILFSILSLLACKTSENTALPPTFHFNGLVGQWMRTNYGAGLQTYERWDKVRDSLYMGFGFTLKEKDTVFREDIRLVLKDSVWHYNVFLAGSSAVTSFVFTKMTDASFTCENQQNEFPKIIEYAIIVDTLSAKISGGGKEVMFSFVRDRLIVAKDPLK